MCKISVLIPIYNVEKYLNKCFDSILVSTLSDIEIIAIDDGSKDSSGRIIDDYAKKDNRIIVIHKENGGYGSAINAGLEVATGEYISIVESDDWISPNMYEVLYKNAKKYNADCIKGNFFYCPGENIFSPHKFLNSLPLRSIFKLKDHTELLLLAPSIWSAIYKLDFIKNKGIKCTLKISPYEDFPFACEVYSKADSIVLIDEPLYYYRCEPKQGSSTIRNDRKLFKVVYQFQNTLEIVKEIGSLSYLREVIFKHIYNCVFLFVGNAHKNIKKELFCEFGNLYNSEYSVGLKYTFFNRKEKIVVGIIKNKKYFLYENLIKYKNFMKRICDMCKKIIFIFKKFKYKCSGLYKFLRNVNFYIEKIISLEKELNYNKSLIFDLFLDRLIEKRGKRDFDSTEYLSQIVNAPEYLCVDSNHNYLNILIKQPPFFYKEKKFNLDKTIVSWEMARWPANMDVLLYSIKQNKNIIFIGDSFLRSINTMVDKNAEEKYRKGISFGIDDLGYYYDATRTNRMEQMLNDKNLVITENQKQRARICIKKIVDNYLTKYNYQPIYEPKIGRNAVEKVLVIDQTYGDMSIVKGLADENTFKTMLDSAIKENPNADIIVKTHPDTISGTGGGYFKGLKAHDNIYTQTDLINPISLIKYVDKIYVCTTQFGFEALMCGKEVHVFGMPFYAGWGLTIDRQKCDRRTNKRSLEEIFYIAYIMYSYYVNPEKQCRCEIEEAMDYLLKLREEYFKNNK